MEAVTTGEHVETSCEQWKPTTGTFIWCLHKGKSEMVTKNNMHYTQQEIEGLVRDCGISSVSAMEIAKSHLAIQLI